MHLWIPPLVTAAVYALRRFAPKIPKPLLPWISAVAGVAAAIGAPGDPALAQRAVQGLVDGLAAAGLWNAVGTHIAPVPPPPGPPPPPAPV